ncbi:DUF397 domain-containing protein [Kitasatospora sp. NPDC004669]|uniref:DUF397 domain-containing protein n=1 Tax=Kitasatospora sp. NPDC004669 TaxID=3154555 RepID=UPI0033ACF680
MSDINLTAVRWMKSSFSQQGGNCVEVAVVPLDLAGAQWVKSRHSGNGGNCIEVAPDAPGVMPVRDSKDPEGAVLLFPIEAWRSFVAATAAGEFGDI